MSSQSSYMTSTTDSAFTGDPTVIESTSHQSFITRVMTEPASKMTSLPRTFSTVDEFKEYIQKRVEEDKYSLRLGPDLGFEGLNILVREGLGLDELLKPIDDELELLLENSTKQQSLATFVKQETAYIVEEIGQNMLNETYE